MTARGHPEELGAAQTAEPLFLRDPLENAPFMSPALGMGPAEFLELGGSNPIYQKDTVTRSAPAWREFPLWEGIFHAAPGKLGCFGVGFQRDPSALPQIRAGATCDFPAPALILLDIPAAAAASIMKIQTGN